MSSTILLAFLAAAVPAFFTPGPNNLMLMASTAKFGLARTLPHAVGVILGFPLMTVIVGMGLGELFVQVPAVKTVLKIAAAAYFLWMAWTLLGFRIGAAKGAERPLRMYEAMAFQWINPKAWIMAVAFVALVVETGEGHGTSLAALGFACLALAPLSSGLWMVFGQGLEALLRRTGTERYLGIVLAGLMVLAVVLFLL